MMGVGVVFPSYRLIGRARWLLEQAETRTDDEMEGVWNRMQDQLEAQMIRCGFDLDERARQLHALRDAVQAERCRQAYEGWRHGPDEAA